MLLQALALGIAFRFALHIEPNSQGIYIVEYLFVTLSVGPIFLFFFFPTTSNAQPCAFIASDYILLGRLVRYLESGKHLLVSPNRITITFVISDVATFLIQVGGLGHLSWPPRLNQIPSH